VITINNSDLPPTDWSSLNARSWPAFRSIGMPVSGASGR